MKRFFPAFPACALCVLSFAVIAHSQERKEFPPNTDVPPIARTDPVNYREVPHCHGGVGTIETQTLYDSDTFRTKLLFVRTGVLPPKTSIGEHLNRGCEEMYFVLDGPAQFTVDDRTAELPARTTVLSPLRSSCGLYNPNDTPVRFLNLAVSTEKGKSSFVDYGDDLADRRVESPAPFRWTQFDRSLLHPANNAHRGRGAIMFRRVWYDENFETDWYFIDHCVLPPDTSIGYHQHNTIEEVYYVIEGTGRFTVNDTTSDVRPGDALPCRLHDSHGLYNNSDKPLEILVFSVADGKSNDRWTVNWGDDLSGR
ncbi:MAG: cupin domain-containing protein [Candidatus Latescibacteria bacterium]|nr:cupin domain-containing protein [Candidatus Latescibacterota bacterium]